MAPLSYRRAIGHCCLSAVMFSWCFQPANGKLEAQSQNADSHAEEDVAKDVALSALMLLHNNQIPKLYEEDVSELQKKTGLINEARAVATWGPIAQMLPGLPKQRRLLFAQRSSVLPILFEDHKGNFYSFVFLATYPSGDYQEEVYMVKEGASWKVAAITVKNTL